LKCDLTLTLVYSYYQKVRFWPFFVW